MTTVYTYEIWTPAGDLREWGAFTSDDLVYQGDDLAQIAAEMINVRLVQPPWLPPLDDGEFRLWVGNVDGHRMAGLPDYVGDIAALKE